MFTGGLFFVVYLLFFLLAIGFWKKLKLGQFHAKNQIILIH